MCDFFGVSYHYYRGSTSFLNDDFDNLDNYLFQVPKIIFTTIIFYTLYNFSLFIDADPYQTKHKKYSTAILKNFLENIGNYLYLWFRNYFPSKAIFKVCKALKKVQ